MNIKRQIQELIVNDFFKGKIITILGARQVGKSTLIKHIAENFENKLFFDGENSDTNQLLSNQNEKRLKQIVGNSNLVIIDEAQKIDNIGSILKLFADYLPNVQVIASGSSAFELRNQLNEPLTGRKFEYQLFPLSFLELKNHTNILDETRALSHRMVFGYYPDVVVNFSDEERILRFLADSYLYKDIFLFKGIKKPEKLLELLKALAWQIGSEVSYTELGNLVGIENKTVEDYIHLLEQAFVIYRLKSFHSNHRKELKKSKKIYFNDLGIRNALINDFRPIEIRQDKGNLFENFMINEFRKQNKYNQIFANFYFWRTHDQQEIDLLIEKNNFYKTYEFKWNQTKSTNISKTFSKKYPNHSFDVIHSQNFYQYLLAYEN